MRQKISTCQPLRSRRARSRGPVRVEGSKISSATLGGSPAVRNTFSMPMMVRECPSCCRYSGDLSAWQDQSSASSQTFYSGKHCDMRPTHSLGKLVWLPPSRRMS